MAENPIKKKGLGRGLSHLFGEAEASYRVSTPEAPAATQAPPTARRSTPPGTHLRPGKFQPRRHFDETLLDELASSIRQHGLLQPILVRAIAGGPDASKTTPA